MQIAYTFQAPSEQSWLDRPEWHDEALCAGMDQAWFFLEDRDWLAPRHEKNAEQYLPGLTICPACKVREQCLEAAVKDPALDFGIRGGKTTAERRKIRRRRSGLSVVS